MIFRVSFSQPPRRSIGAGLRMLFGTVTLGLLVACGGGGGGGTTPAPPPAPPAPPPPPPDSFTVGGTLLAPPGQGRDGDTNDIRSVALPNNDPDAPQPIGNPSTLGGYVNEAGAGAEGLSQLDGDPEDYFVAELLAGQRINLLVADFLDADADLYLYDESGELVDFSIATGELEEINVASNGRYLINVSIFSGATNYTLAVGVPLTPAGAGNFSDSAVTAASDIVPWEVIVEHEEDSADLRSDLLRRWDARRIGGGDRRAQLLRMRSELTDQRTQQRRLGKQAQRRDSFADPTLAARWETLIAIKELSKQPGVRTAEPNYRVVPLASVNDDSYPLQWHYPLINLPGAWDTTTGDPQVIVAVVDTGILAGHPDLQGQLVPGYDFVRDADEAGDGDGIDPDPEETIGDGAPDAVNFHGTHVAGTVAAAGNNDIGVAGVAYSSRVMPVRALAATGGTSYDVRQAVRFAAGLENDSGTVPDRPADVINLSLGGAGFSNSSQDLYNELRDLGIVVVAAAGNESTTAPSYPAAYDNVFSVSAIDVQQRITGYSNRGSSVDISAPGGDGSRDLNGDGYPDGVLSTGARGQRFAYTFLSGTSMASPHVAGVFALMKAANGDINAGDIDQLLREGRLTEDLGDAGRDDLYGYGRIDARRAIDAALVAGGAESQLPPRVSGSSGALNFSTGRSTLDITLNNSGGGEVRIAGIVAEQPWLSVEAATVDDNGLGRYRVSVARDNLDPGLYEGEVQVASTANALTIRVLMAVADGSEGELGVIYVVLYDPVADESIAGQVLLDGEDGYRFSIPDIPAGEYQLYAGTDLDNDDLICDAGEACGAHLTIEQPLTFTVDGDRSDFEFPIEYLLALPDSSAAILGDGQGPPPQKQRSAEGIRKFSATLENPP